MNQRPELEVRRQLLTQMRDDLRAKGFQAEMNAEALAVQTPSDDDNGRAVHDKAIADLKTMATNCYRGAEALSAQLAKLPKAKKEKP